MSDLYFPDMTMPAGDIVIEDKSSGTQLIHDLQNGGVINGVEYKPPAGTDKVACMPVLIGSKMAVSFRPRTLLGLTTTSSNSSASPARNMTTRSTRPPRRWTICASQCDRNHDQSLHLIRGSVGFPAAGLGQWPERPESTSTGLSGFATVRVSIRWAKVSR
jgi:hypothetical protein